MRSNLGFVVHQYHACWFSDRPFRAVCVLRLRRSEFSALSADGSAESRENILPHLTTDKSEDGTKKNAKVHRKFTIVIALNHTSVMILLIIRSFHTLTDSACRDIIRKRS